MILSEFVNNLSTNIEKRITPQDSYNSMEAEIKRCNRNQILDFSIKNDQSLDEAKLSGIIDFANAQFVIRKLEFAESFNGDIIETTKRLLNSLITNLEMQYPEIDIIFWRVNKNYSSYIKAALDKQFTIQDTNSYAFELTYHTASYPVRKNYNGIKIQKTINDDDDSFLDNDIV